MLRSRIHQDRPIHRRIVVCISLISLFSFGLAACGTPVTTVGDEAPQAANESQTQSHEGGGVTITLTRLAQAPTIAFEVIMDTHAVALDGYDLRQLATLHVDQGPAIQASGWDAPAGGHHREGTLTFPATTEDGRPVLSDDARTLEVIIRDIGAVPERILQWTP